LRVITPKNESLVEQTVGSLHRGEAEALVLAEEFGALLIVDDQPARRVALRRGSEHTGTAAVVAEAGLAGVISVADVEPILRRLQADGMRLTDAIVESVLERLRPASPS
jgi:predicted nucleic acid-binding protein